MLFHVYGDMAVYQWLAMLGYIICQAKKRHINPYKEEVFVNQKYYKDAEARIA